MTNHATSLEQSVRQDVRAGTAPPRSLFGWFREYGKDAPIALFTLIAVVSHLLLRFAWKTPGVEELPLYIALLVGGIPLIVGLVRQAIRLEFGSDWLAGISIVTATLLHQYLVARIVILMLSGGSALEQYATRRASSALRALARRMPTTAHRVTEAGSEIINAQDIVRGDILANFPHEICPVDGVVIDGHGDMDESYLTGEPFETAKALALRSFPVQSTATVC